jgi:pyruvate dehydrogenase E1 component alpha subunit/2-oxoisovalerate dehydrogenase E1 component alpha subunit
LEGSAPISGSEKAPDPSSSLVSDLHRDDLLEIYRALIRARAAEERLEVLFRQGHVSGGLYRSLGQEGASVGAAYALRRRDDATGDVIAHTIRDTGALFLFGGTPGEYFRQYLARGTGPTRGKEANVHWTDLRRGFVGPVSPLGTMVGVMSGVTLSFKIRGEPRVGMVFYGDGATSTGAWHEGVNFAGAQGCPLIVVVTANGYAFSTPTRKQTRAAGFSLKAQGYGIAGESVDGNDVLAVYQAARRSVDRAREGKGPTLLELRTYRRKGHAQHDPQLYVPPEEIRAWEERDPIDLFRGKLLGEGWAREGEVRRLEVAAETEMREEAERAVGDPPPSGVGTLTEVYTDLPTQPPWTRPIPPGFPSPGGGWRIQGKGHQRG